MPNPVQTYFALSDSDISEFRFIGRFIGNGPRTRFLYPIYRKFRWFDTRFIGSFQDVIRNNVYIYDTWIVKFSIILVVNITDHQSSRRIEHATSRHAGGFKSAKVRSQCIARVMLLSIICQMCIKVCANHSGIPCDTQAILNCGSAVFDLAKLHWCQFCILLCLVFLFSTLFSYFLWFSLFSSFSYFLAFLIF